MAHQATEEITCSSEFEEGAMTTKAKPALADSSTDGNACVVCGAPHYGLHFGVLACAGCASFFRRTIVERKAYKCRGNNKCNVGANSRVSCRACRYQACLTAGMSADSIRSATTRTTAPEPSESSRKSQEGDTVIAHSQPSFAHYVYVAPNNTDAPSSNPSPLLNKYVVGIRSYYNAMRSAYFLENPQYVFADPPLAKDDAIGFTNRERKFAPILLRIVNEILFPSTQLSITDQKRVFRRFTNGFNEMFCYWMTAKSYPVASNVFVSHYGYYMDLDDLQDFFKGAGPTAEAHHRLSIPIMTQCTKMKQKFYELGIDETELAALTGLWMFAALEHADLLRSDLSQQRDAVIDELHRYLTVKVGTTGVGVRIGRLLLYLQSLTELMTVFSDYVVMGRIFLPGGPTEIWDLLDEHAVELPKSASSHAPATPE